MGPTGITVTPDMMHKGHHTQFLSIPAKTTVPESNHEGTVNESKLSSNQ